MKHKKNKENPKKKGTTTESNRQLTRPNDSRKQNHDIKKQRKEPGSTASKNTSLEKNKMRLVATSNKRFSKGPSGAVATPPPSEYSVGPNSTLDDVQRGSIDDLEDGLGRLSVHEGGRMFQTKKGNILEIVPRDEIERKCYCRGHKPGTGRTISLEETSSNSRTRSDPKKELYRSYSSPPKQPEAPASFWTHEIATFGESELEKWLNDNRICFNQIMIEEKIKRRQLNRPSPQTSASPSKPAWDNRPANEDTTTSFADIMKQEKYKQQPQHLPKSSVEKRYSIQTDKKVLKNHELIRELLEGNRNITYPITELYTLENVNPFCYEFTEIRDLFNKTMLSYKMTSIKQVMNPFLQAHYNLRKRSGSYITEMLLYHGTKIENVDSICTDNFDWRLVSRHKYGWGVSFSSTPYYASHYSDESGSLKVMFAVKVMVRFTRYGDCNTEVPRTPYDTTKDHAGKVYVKYDDCCFYPAYVMYYTRK